MSDAAPPTTSPPPSHELDAFLAAARRTVRKLMPRRGPKPAGERRQESALRRFVQGYPVRR